MSIHTYPVNDLREHDTDGLTCWCDPRVEWEGAEPLVIHNSADGREAVEQAEEIINGRSREGQGAGGS